MINKGILAACLLSSALCADDTFSQFISNHQQTALRICAFPLEKEQALVVAIPDTFMLEQDGSQDSPAFMHFTNACESLVLSQSYAFWEVSQTISLVKSYLENETKNVMRSEIKSLERNGVHIAQYFLDASYQSQNAMVMVRQYQDTASFVSIQYTVKYNNGISQYKKNQLEKKIIELFDSFEIFPENQVRG